MGSGVGSGVSTTCVSAGGAGSAGEGFFARRVAPKATRARTAAAARIRGSGFFFFPPDFFLSRIEASLVAQW